MRRHHYLYLRNTYMTVPEVLAALERIHRDHAAAHAREVGILDPNGRGSWTHPGVRRGPLRHRHRADVDAGNINRR